MRLNQVQREFDLFYLRNDSQQKFALGNEMIELIDYVDELDCQVIGLPLQAHQDKCYECDYDAPSLEKEFSQISIALILWRVCIKGAFQQLSIGIP